MAQFDRHSVTRFFRLAAPFFRSEARWKAWGMVALILGLSFTINGVSAWMSYISRDFMTALNLKHTELFFRKLAIYVGAFLIATPIVVLYSYAEQRLSLMWRRWLSRFMLERYFAHRAYYHINLKAEIDNPDQRIAADVQSFCSQSLSFFLIFFNSSVQLVLYVYVLWSISWVLFAAAVGYSAIGSIITYFLGRPLIGLNFAQLQKEADYRYKLINVRDSAESIAFYGREQREYVRTRQRLKVALDNLLQVINWNRNLQFFTTGYNYLLTVLPTLIVAPLFFEGQIEFGSVIQAGAAFGFVINALSIVVNHFGNLSVFAAVINRLGTFSEAVERANIPLSPSQQIESLPGDQLEFRGVTIFTPREEQALVRDLSFRFQGRSLLIAGPSGSGKSSILRVIAGLWTTGTGTVLRPDLSDALFLPQRPYMVLGSLRSQLLYGLQRKSVTSRQIDEVLAAVHLEEVVRRVGGLEATLDWPNVLGTGEQQRFALARLLLFEPRIAFLDEATTAVDRNAEKELYRLLSKSVERYISIGSVTNLGGCHEHLLQLKGDGTWSYR